MRYVPVVEDNNSRSDLFSRLLKDRIILVTGEVNEDMADLVVAQLLYLESENSEEDIKMYINSPGGSINQGMAIYDTMKTIKCDVQTICVGLAASMGSFLLAGGTPGKRYATENSEIMIHQPSGGSQGQMTEMKISYQHIEKIRVKLENLLAKFTGKDVEKINKDCERDTWMTAEEAKEYGLVDEVIENK